MIGPVFGGRSDALRDIRLHDGTLTELHQEDEAFFLRSVEIERQRAPDLKVFLSRRLALTDYDCILGLSFLQTFDEVHYFPPKQEALLVAWL
jgi:hypothetical protein